MTLLLFALFISSFAAADTPLEQAQQEYLLAEKESVEKQHSRFNQALALYMSEQPSNPSGKLLYNMANIHFYLKEFGLAIALYRRAESLLPRNDRIQENLTIALEHANVQAKQIERPIADLFGFRWLSAFERGLLLLGMTFAVFLFFSLHLWFPQAGFQLVWKSMLALTTIIFTSIVCYALAIPPRAIILRTTALRTTPHKEAALTQTTVQQGEMVELLSTDHSKQWLEVRTPFGIAGYVSVHGVYFITP